MTPTARLIAEWLIDDAGLDRRATTGVTVASTAHQVAILARRIEDALLADDAFMERAGQVTATAVREALAGVSEEHS